MVFSSRTSLHQFAEAAVRVSGLCLGRRLDYFEAYKSEGIALAEPFAAQLMKALPEAFFCQDARLAGLNGGSKSEEIEEREERLNNRANPEQADRRENLLSIARLANSIMRSGRKPCGLCVFHRQMIEPLQKSQIEQPLMGGKYLRE